MHDLLRFYISHYTVYSAMPYPNLTLKQEWRLERVSSLSCLLITHMSDAERTVCRSPEISTFQRGLKFIMTYYSFIIHFWQRQKLCTMSGVVFTSQFHRRRRWDHVLASSQYLSEALNIDTGWDNARTAARRLSRNTWSPCHPTHTHLHSDCSSSLVVVVVVVLVP